MFQSNALTLKELQSIQSKHKNPAKAAEQLFNIVMNQSGNVYSYFLDALKNTGHQHMFEDIGVDSYKGTHWTRLETTFLQSYHWPTSFCLKQLFFL